MKAKKLVEVFRLKEMPTSQGTAYFWENINSFPVTGAFRSEAEAARHMPDGIGVQIPHIENNLIVGFEDEEE